MPAPYTVKPASIAPLYCDIYEDGEKRLLLTVWNKPGDHGAHAKEVATRIASLLNQAEYPLGEEINKCVRCGQIGPGPCGCGFQDSISVRPSTSPP
jgi:hypothetical protein